MYGSIFNLKVKPGHTKDLLKALESRTPDGAIAWFVMQPDDEAKDLIAIAVFKDKKAYQENANSPEQHESFLEIMSYLQEEPSWTDGAYISSEIIQASQ